MRSTKTASACSGEEATRIYRVAIVDDHPIYCDAVADAFSESANFQLVGKGSSASDALKIAESVAPDMIVMDLKMPGSGLAAISSISKINPTIKLLVLTAYDDVDSVRQALDSGATGYAIKGMSGSELLDLALSTLRGNHYAPMNLVRQLLADTNTDGIEESRASARAQLSEREVEILGLVSEGRTNAEIAGALGLAESTIKNHVTRILEKTSARNRVEAALLPRDWKN